jgi:hypothetical protein
MPARKTESRVPQNLQPSDLGQVTVASDGKCALISFVTSPVIINRENAYVVFIMDGGLAAQAASYEWTIAESTGPPKVETSAVGEFFYTPISLGSLHVAVRILDAGATEQAKLTMTQEVAPTSAALEALINEATEKPGPSAGDPDILRELVNQHNLYYQNVTLQTPEPGDGFKRFVFSTVYDGASQRSVDERKRHMDQLMLALNEGAVDFVTLSAQGAGVSGIRPLLLSMVVPDMLAWTLLPQDANQRALAVTQLLQSLAALDENKRIDLCNIVRFPKSNITFCGRILETLRNEYFNATSFDDVLTGMSGVRAQWITDQYHQGPIARNA